MKVLIVSHYFLPHMGGIEKVVYYQARQLAKRGHKVTIVTSDIPRAASVSPVDNIRIVRVRALNLLENYFGIPFPLFSPMLYLILMREIALCDIVHVHGHIYLSTLEACFIAKRLNKPIVLTQQNTFIEHGNTWLRFIERVFDRTVGAYTLQSASRIIAASNRTREYVKSIVKQANRIAVQYNGIDTGTFHPIKDKSTAKKKLGLQGKFICLTIRRITFKNGIDTFLETANMCKQNPDIIFVLGGNGPDFTRVKQYVSEMNIANIKLVGYISDSELPSYYQAADVFVLPSKKGEGFPLVVLEAFSSGIPVIATRSGGHEEVIQDNETGFLVDVGDVRNISNRIQYLYSNPSMRAKMSDTCRKLVMSGFSWQKNVSVLEEYYQKEVNG